MRGIYTQKAQSKAFGMDHFIDKRDISEQEKQDLKKLLNGRKTPQIRPGFEIIVMAQKQKEGNFVDNFAK